MGGSGENGLVQSKWSGIGPVEVFLGILTAFFFLGVIALGFLAGVACVNPLAQMQHLSMAEIICGVAGSVIMVVVKIFIYLTDDRPITSG